MMSERAAHLGQSLYDSASGARNDEGESKNWSPDRRFRIPSSFAPQKGKPVSSDELWYHEDPDANPYTPKAHTYLAKNPMYAHVIQNMNAIAHAFTANDIAHAQSKIPEGEYLSDFTSADFRNKKLSDKFLQTGKNQHFYKMMQIRNGLEASRSEADELSYHQIEDAYTDLFRSQENSKGNEANYLQLLRRKYSELLQQVTQLDRDRSEKLSTLLLTKDALGRNMPNISHLEFPIKWDEYDTKGEKALRKQFAPDPTHMDHMISRGWTQDRFLKMMLQIPEMELYLNTNGYRDFSPWGPPEFNIRRQFKSESPGRMSPSPSIPRVLLGSVESDRRGGGRSRSHRSMMRSVSREPEDADEKRETTPTPAVRRARAVSQLPPLPETPPRPTPAKILETREEDFDEEAVRKQIQQKIDILGDPGEHTIENYMKRWDKTREQKLQMEHVTIDIEAEARNQLFDMMSKVINEIYPKRSRVYKKHALWKAVALHYGQSKYKGKIDIGDVTRYIQETYNSPAFEKLLSKAEQAYNAKIGSSGANRQRINAAYKKEMEDKFMIELNYPELQVDRTYEHEKFGPLWTKSEDWATPNRFIDGDWRETYDDIIQERGTPRRSPTPTGPRRRPPRIPTRRLPTPPPPLPILNPRPRSRSSVRANRRSRSRSSLSDHRADVLARSRSISAAAAPAMVVGGAGVPMVPVPIMAPVNANELIHSVVARPERTVAPSAMGSQSLFRGYLRDVQGNVAPMGRVHLVSMANIATRGHFMQELTTDANMGRRKVEAESRHGPFRDARGNYMTKARSANIRYQVRNRAIHITVHRGAHTRELDVLIGKLAAHRMTVNNSRITLVVNRRKMRLGKLDNTDLGGLRETVQRALTKNTSIGIMIHDEKPNGALHKKHLPDRKYLSPLQ